MGFTENVVYAGIPAAIEQFASRGARLGVCTSKLAAYSERILAMFGVRDYFSFVDGGDIGVKKSQQLGGLLDRRVIDRNAVMIGDRGVDIEAARANGLRSIGVLWGFGTPEEIASANSTCVAGTVDDLVATVTSGNPPVA